MNSQQCSVIWKTVFYIRNLYLCTVMHSWCLHRCTLWYYCLYVLCVYICVCSTTDTLTLFLFLSVCQVQKQVPLCVWQPLQVQLEALGQVGHPDQPQRARVLRRRKKGGVRNECADSGSLGALRTKTLSLKDFMRWFFSFDGNKTHSKLLAALWTLSKLQDYFQWYGTITFSEFHYPHFHPSLTCQGWTDI